MGAKKTDSTKLPKELHIVRDARPLPKQVVDGKGFTDFTILEYNLFWILHLLIIAGIIYFVGGDIDSCFQFFLRVINPVSWF